MQPPLHQKRVGKIFFLTKSEKRVIMITGQYLTVTGGITLNKIITIGREFGSGGRELGKRLAENLGIAYYDKEIIEEISKRTRLAESYVQQIVEQKTGKGRVFTVPLVIAQYIENYCLRNGIGRNDLIFPVTARAIQKQRAIVCDYLGYEGIGTHSFRKWYATEIYKANGYDIALVQRLLQHSSAATTQHYIGIESQRVEQASQDHALLI